MRDPDAPLYAGTETREAAAAQRGRGFLRWVLLAFAVGIGGPGAVFWMIVGGFLGMSAKFAECTLGQKYRIVRDDGHVSGGSMIFLRRGLEEIGYGALGRVLAVVFAVMCIGGSFGGGNMFQSNQASEISQSVVPFLSGRAGGAVFGCGCRHDGHGYGVGAGWCARSKPTPKNPGGA